MVELGRSREISSGGGIEISIMPDSLLLGEAVSFRGSEKTKE